MLIVSSGVAPKAHQRHQLTLGSYSSSSWEGRLLGVAPYSPSHVPSSSSGGSSRGSRSSSSGCSSSRRWRLPVGHVSVPCCQYPCQYPCCHPPRSPTAPPATPPPPVAPRYFGNVCELDLIFNFHKAYYILDELLIAGGSGALQFRALYRQ